MSASERPAPRARSRRRLARSADFDRVFRQGRSRGSRYLVLHAFPRAAGDDGPRLGVSVSRKVGGAVERNRVKRLLREAFWALSRHVPVEHDVVLVARPELAELARAKGGRGVEEALRELLPDGARTT